MRRTNLYLDPDKLRALKMLAASEDASVSDLVREAIDTLIDRRLNERAADPHATPTLDDVLRRVDAKRPPLTQDEIDRDIAEAITESRADRTNRRWRSPSLRQKG
jgi:hypothetical protein